MNTQKGSTMTTERLILTPASQLPTRAWSTTRQHLVEAIHEVLPEAWHILPDGQTAADAIAHAADAKAQDPNHPWSMSREDYEDSLQKIDLLETESRARAAKAESEQQQPLAPREPATAYVTAMHTDKRTGVLTVESRCPYCAKTHTHGWPLTDPEGSSIGHRVPHCQEQRPNRGYNIALPESA